MREMPDGTEWRRCPSFNKFRMSGWGARLSNRPSRVSGNPDGIEKTSPLLSRRRIPAYSGRTVGGGRGAGRWSEGR